MCSISVTPFGKSAQIYKYIYFSAKRATTTNTNDVPTGTIGTPTDKRATTTNTNDATTGTIGTPTHESVFAKIAGTIAGISVALVAVIIMGVIYFRRTQENEIRRHTEHER